MNVIAFLKNKRSSNSVAYTCLFSTAGLIIIHLNKPMLAYTILRIINYENLNSMRKLQFLVLYWKNLTENEKNGN